MGGGGDTTSTTKVELSPAQKDLINTALPGVKSYLKNPPNMPSYSGVAGFTPAQLQGQYGALGAANTQNALGGQAAGATDFLLNSALSPSTNPALQGTIDAAVRPINEQLTREALPGVRSEARMAGQYGGSRQGIAEGMAIQGAQRAAGDTAAQVANQGYQSGMDAMVKTLGLVPQTQGAQVTGSLTQSGVGDVQQNLQQNQLDELIQRYMYGQQKNYLASKDILGLAMGIPNAGTTSSVSGGNNGTASALSGALGGATLGTAIMPGVGTAVGAGLGGLLSLF